MSDTATAPAPPPAEAPAVEPAPPSAPSTGGVGKPAPRPISVTDAQSAFRQAYGRQKEMAEQAEAPAEAPPEAPARAAAPARPAQPVPARGLEGRARDDKGRLLPRQAAAPAVDAPPREGAQSPPTPAPPRAAPAQPPATRPAAAPPERAADAPPSPTESAPDEASPQTPAPQTEASRDDEFRTARWQRAFQAEAGLRRTVGRIRANPGLSEAQKAAQLAEKLSDGERAADAAEWRAEQMRRLRDENPQAFIQQLRTDEAEAEASNQLALRITQMIAEAYEVDPDDPDFLEAGPREGDDRVEGLKRFVDFTSRKSPVFKTALTAALQEQAQAHERALADLRAQHKVDLEAAAERGRAQARSPFGRNGAPPRSNGTGVLPVGQDNDGTGGQRAPAKAPTVASVRDALGAGYQQREQAR